MAERGSEPARRVVGVRAFKARLSAALDRLAADGSVQRGCSKPGSARPASTRRKRRLLSDLVTEQRR